MNFFFKELFNIMSDPLKKHSVGDTVANTFAVPVKAKVVSVTQPSFTQRWFTLRVIDPNKNPLTNLALGLVTEKLIDTVIPFMARSLWKVVTILPGKIKLTVGGTLATISGINYVLRAVIPTGLLSAITEFPQNVRNTLETVQQTVSNSVVVSNAVKELAGTVKMYTNAATQPPIAEETAKQTAPTTILPEPALEAAQKAIEVTAGHSWLYYVGWTVVGIGLFSYGMKGLDYVITHYAFRGPLQPSHLSKLPIESTEPSTYFDVFYSVVLQPFDQAAGIILYGAAFVWAGFTLRIPTPVETSEEVALIDKRIFKRTPPESNILTLPPSAPISATPQEKAELVTEAETNVDVETPLLDEIADLETLNELPPQLDAMDKLINTLTQDELMAVVTSPMFQVWQTQPEQFTYAMEKIATVTGSERLVLIMQIFGS